MPLMRVPIRKKKSGGTTTAGQGRFFIQESGLVTSSNEVANPHPGYVGPMDIILCGASSGPGLYWSPDSKGGTQGSGQVVWYRYMALGDEVNFTLMQTNYQQGQNGRLILRVNGGANDGKVLCVGSAMADNNYGAACAAVDAIAQSTLPYTAIPFNGACRPYNSTIYYTDDTSYPPQAPASYGAASNVSIHSNGTRRITLRGSATPGGMLVENISNGTVIGDYGKANSTTPSGWTSSVSRGACIFSYPN